jgi:FkbM family methyltransferase
MRAKAWAFAQDYDADAVVENYWKPVLGRFELALERRRDDLVTVPDPKRMKPQVREADGLLWIDRGGKSGDQLGPDAHEQELWPILDRLLPENGVFLDVGAHVGHWSLRLAAKASKVIAVEANPVTASTLRRNIALNDIQNIEVREFAAWDEDTALVLDDPYNQVAGGSTRVLPAENYSTLDERRARTIPARRLDERLTQVDRIDLVKIDVEGADIHVLDGMTGLVKRLRPTLFIECHDIYGYYERADLEAALTRLGYRWETAFSYQSTWMPHGQANTPQLADYLVAVPEE